MVVTFFQSGFEDHPFAIKKPCIGFCRGTDLVVDMFKNSFRSPIPCNVVTELGL